MSRLLSSSASRWAYAGLIVALLAAAGFAWLVQPAGWRWVPPGVARWTAAAAVVLLYLGGCAVVLRRRLRGTVSTRHADLRVVHASQTGTAEEIARRTAALLCQGGVPAVAQPLAGLDAAALSGAHRLLFVVSTTGDGDAPDGAVAFQREWMHARTDLSRLRFGLLALGDRRYSRFCGFGMALDAWLRNCGASPLFDRIDVDSGDALALQRWQQALGFLSGGVATTAWMSPHRRWRLSAREHLNPGSPGGPVFRVVLVPAGGGVGDWSAGDVAEIAVPVAEADRRSVPRTYSIASIPEDGQLELIVRLQCGADGRPGIGSGWLTRCAPIGAEVELCIRENPSFRPPPDDAPMILIGNGTGLAGLRAHLRARARTRGGRNWLLFGERCRGSDFLCRDEIETWQASGVLAHVDLAFSRDGEAVRYVQDALRRAAARLVAWVDQGAYVYVCGSLKGMAPGVDAVLRQILGAAVVDDLRAQGRYRRDVY
ncbi:MAG: sulfite reductase subunit alpha [Nevskiales bacterium]|nr:sulfite reductase subunit alpha [Nevskiales bacterium]